MKDKPKEWIRLEVRLKQHHLDKLHKFAARDTEGNVSLKIRKLVEEAK
jgi:hypothetical protein